MSVKYYIPQKIGEVVSTRGETCFGWKIIKFYKLTKYMEDSYHESDEIYFLDCRWQFEISQWGENDDESNRWFSIYLHKKDDGPPINVNFTIGIRKADGEDEIVCKEEGYTFYTYGNGGRSKCLNVSDLMRRKSELVPSDVLTIICTMSSGMRHSVEGVNPLVPSLKNLLLGGEYSDVVMKVEGKKFKAHKAILGARSPVFASMFELDMKEKSCGAVDILDCTAEVFKAFLFYLYTGNMGVCVPDDVPLLYYTADKYGIEDLKVHCVQIMKKSLSVDIFYDVIALSLCHDESELLETAARFLRQNEEVIIESDEWHRFMQEHPIDANEIYMKAMEY